MEGKTGGQLGNARHIWGELMHLDEAQEWFGGWVKEEGWKVDQNPVAEGLGFQGVWLWCSALHFYFFCDIAKCSLN